MESEAQSLLEVREMTNDENNTSWTKADALFVANAVREIYADEDATQYGPRATQLYATKLCLLERSILPDPTKYI